jgi:hypothetical protein
VKALSAVFQAKFRDGLWALHRAGKLAFAGQLASLAELDAFAGLMRQALAKPWTVYAKRPFAGPAQVLAYLSRYTHRVAIGSGRICALDPAAQTVTFRYKDYADQHRQKRMTLGTAEFLRRFCLHILPARFVKIRHYGLHGNHQRKAKLTAARAALERQDARSQRVDDGEAPPAQGTGSGTPPPRCPRCGSLHLRLLEHLLPRRLDSS